MARCAEFIILPAKAPSINIIGGVDEITNVSEICCMVCTENKIKVSFQCGHALCIKCTNRVVRCPLCSKHIINRTKLFI